jgi:pSer/pThr/pTyr-binding forkhead associated (FHA) protein
MIKCSECGYENMDGLDYCDGCGAKLAAPGSAPAAEPPPAASTEPAATESAPSEPAPSEPAAGAAAAAAEPAPTAPPSEAPTGEIKAPAAEPAAEAAAPSAAASNFKAKLAIIRGGRRGQEFELESGNNFVGRWDPDTGAFPEVDLDADDPEAKVSRKHALIIVSDSKITIEDIGSLNGTFVNRGARLSPGSPTELKTGDEIIIGKTFLKLSIDPIS